MKVVHCTDNLLVVEDRPWFIGGLMILMALLFLFGGMAFIGKGELFGGLMMILVGGGVPLIIAALMVQRVRVTLDRSTGRMTRTARSVRGLGQTAYPLNRLTGARLGTSSDSDGTTYRLEFVLDSPAEVVPFTSYYSGGTRPQRLGEAVNAWLATDRLPIPRVT